MNITMYTVPINSISKQYNSCIISFRIKRKPELEPNAEANKIKNKSVTGTVIAGKGLSEFGVGALRYKCVHMRDQRFSKCTLNLAF